MEQFITIIQAQNRIALPKEIRRQLGLKKSDRVRVTIEKLVEGTNISVISNSDIYQ